MELVLELLRDQPVRVAGALHDRAAGSGFTAHEQRDADEAVVADHRDFRRRAVGQDVQQGYDGVDRKIHVAQDIAWLVQDLPERQRDEPEVRVQSFAFRRGQRSQQVVLLRIVGAGHGERTLVNHHGLGAQSIAQQFPPLSGTALSPRWRTSIPSLAWARGTSARKSSTWVPDGADILPI